MKFCYIDESGTGEEPFAVMVGVVADSHRMKVTKKHWTELLKSLSGLIGRELSELHTRNFYSGSGVWRGIDGEKRSQIISSIFDWLEDRRHHVVYTAVSKEKFYSEFSSEDIGSELSTLWRFMAYHICLSLQKHFQSQQRNKGNTVLVFDNEEREEKRFTDLVLNPPDWSDSYYQRGRRQDKLDQIIDVPHFVDSQDVGLIQLADFLCYFLRRYIEIKEDAVPPRYADEETKVTAWVAQALNQSIPKSAIYLSHGRCQCSDLFHRYAPACIL